MGMLIFFGIVCMGYMLWTIHGQAIIQKYKELLEEIEDDKEIEEFLDKLSEDERTLVKTYLSMDKDTRYKMLVNHDEFAGETDEDTDC